MSEKRLLTFLAAAPAEYAKQPGGLLLVLRAIQGKFGYLPEAALDELVEDGAFGRNHVRRTVDFFDEFRRKPATGTRVGVCHGTACHTAGASRVLAALEANLPESTEVVRTGCLGCCTLAPVVQLNERVIGHADPTSVVAEVTGRRLRRESDEPGPGLASSVGAVSIRVGIGSCCRSKGADAVLDEVMRWAGRWPSVVKVAGVGCVAACSETPLLQVSVGGGDWRSFTRVRPEDVGAVLTEAVPESTTNRVRRGARRALEWLHGASAGGGPGGATDEMAAFLAGQVRIATEGLGEIVPTDLQQAREAGTFESFEWALTHPDETLDMVARSGLRGRGGAGFATADKWRMAKAANASPLIVANGDEGDPGAFMDRMLLESFPFRVLEGMAIAGAAVGAREGIVYVRDEYALACDRCEAAIAACREADVFHGAFEVTLVRGPSAYVCGEETALLSVLENRGPFPKVRPPFPAEAGYLGRPTVVSNVETLALLPWLMREGPDAFRAHGTAQSPGTKVFALAGKVRRGGLVEVPLGTTIDHIVNGIGGGPLPGRTLKAVQIGGPSGGCIPATHFHLPVTFESLREHGAIMGSGGLVVLDDSDCMVDLARYFVAFSAAQACGGCRPGKEGVDELLDGLDRLCSGQGDEALLESLKATAERLDKSARCGLCRAAPRPFLSSLASFPEEYLAHIEQACPQGRCAALVTYEIDETCTGCTRCVQVCPVAAIEGEPLQLHAVLPERCIACGACRDVCPFDSVRVTTGPGGRAR